MNSKTNGQTNGSPLLPLWETSPLPKPPIPSLEHTLERYLQYASVIRLWDRIPPEDVEGAVGRFFPVATALQEELRDIADSEDNWINKFWLEQMYMKPRYPLPINSSPAYVFPRQAFFDEDDWLSYTSWLAYEMLQFKDLIDRRALDPDCSSSARGHIPFCMDQYDRILSIYRQPKHGADVQLADRYRRIDSTTADQHLLVMCENQPFILWVRKDGYVLSPSEMTVQMRDIVRKSRNRGRENVAAIAAATAANRDDAATFWAEALTREFIHESNILSEEQNAASLALIQSAIFVVCLDGHLQTRFYNENQMVTGGHLLLHGFGADAEGLNRWYDSTIQLIVSLDGFNGLCIEHSVAEGIVIIRMMEHVLKKVASDRQTQIRPPAFAQKIYHQPLSWILSDTAQRHLDSMSAEFDALANDLRLTLYSFTDFGKEWIKSQRVSPDGLVQMALQLAHFRQHGYLVSTYESAAMRSYRYGRVDNIRAATPEVLAWVTVMFDRSVPPKEKRVLFDRAARKQALIIGENVRGFGIDNHLCALEVLAREAVDRGRLPRMPEIFEQKTYAELMRFPLSTSQVTPDPQFDGCYLCYGPVVKDGYGCAYSLQSNSMLFAISDMKSDLRTSGIGFESALKESLQQIRWLLDEA